MNRYAPMIGVHHLKPERAEAYNIHEPINVVRAEQRPGYKTFWLFDDKGRAFRTKDFR